jgi:hypothetical protein
MSFASCAVCRAALTAWSALAATRYRNWRRRSSRLPKASAHARAPAYGCAQRTAVADEYLVHSVRGPSRRDERLQSFRVFRISVDVVPELRA